MADYDKNYNTFHMDRQHFYHLWRAGCCDITRPINEGGSPPFPPSFAEEFPHDPLEGHLLSSEMFAESLAGHCLGGIVL